MKVCFITTGLAMGGAEKQVSDLTDEFVVLGHQVMIISLTGDTVIKPKSMDVEINELHMSKTPWGIFHAMMRARKLIKNFSPDIVHSHMIHANIFARILRIFTKIPRLICTAHNTNEGGKGRILAYRVTDKLADINTNVSQEAVEAFIKNGAVTKDRMIAVGNGIDIERFVFSEQYRNQKRKLLNIDDETSFYLAVGRLDEQKDYYNMIYAFADFLSQPEIENKKIILAIIGQGALDEELNNLVNELNISSSIIFLGLQMDIEQWMSAADFYLMSSAWEGLPLVIAEAMASSCFVIATDCGGVKEMIQGNGFLVESKNYKDLSSKLQKSLTLNEQEKKSCTLRARSNVIQNYSISAVASQWIEIYKSQHK